MRESFKKVLILYGVIAILVMLIHPKNPKNPKPKA
jgi:hypothetical protein